jgi:hypothetical protein
MREIYKSAKALTNNPAYYHANLPTYRGGGISFMSVSDTPWENGLTSPYPPGKNKYINPEIQARQLLPCLNFSEKSYTNDKAYGKNENKHGKRNGVLGRVILHRFI